MDLRKVLDALLTMELRIAELHRWLTGVFERDTRVSGLFYRLSLQARSHANLIAYQRRLVMGNPGLFGAAGLELKAIEEVVVAVDEFRANNPGPTLSDALQFARAIESMAAEETHLATVAQTSSEIGGLVRVLAGEDRGHERVLASLAESLQQQAVSF